MANRGKLTTLGKRFYVGNIEYSTYPSEVAKFFGLNLGQTDNHVELMMNAKTGQNKGYGFITVPTEQADKVMSFNGREFKGRKLKVTPERHTNSPTKSAWTSSSASQGATSAKPNTIQLHKQDILSPYKLIDIGANLTHKKFQHDLEDVMHRAKTAGVEKIIVTGTSLKASQAACTLAKKHPGFLYFTAGVHPHDAKSWTDETELELEKLIQEPECVSVGECGLDFNRNFSPPEKQKEVFEKQVQMACRHGKPLFLHEREAHDAFMEILTRYYSELPKVVVHCFTGNVTEALKYLGLGYYIGLTGFLAKDRSKNGVKKLLSDKEIPLDKLLIETDAPFMYPYSFELDSRFLSPSCKMIGQNFSQLSRNEPCVLPLVMEIIASVMREDPAVVAKATMQNANTFFNL